MNNNKILTGAQSEQDVSTPSNSAHDFTSIKARIDLELGEKPASDNNDNDGQKLTGLAFSGGGIRSASFTLGVAQALQQNRAAKSANESIYSTFDYLSTVSGGGYTGAALTWAEHNQKSAKQENSAKRSMSMFEYVRQNADYLIPTEALNKSALVGVILRTLLLSLSVYVPFIIGMFFLFLRKDWFGPASQLPYVPESIKTILLAFPIQLNFLELCVLGLFTLMALISVLYSLLTFFNSAIGLWKPIKPYLLRIGIQALLGKLLIIAVLILFAASMDTIYTVIEQYLGAEETSFAAVLAGMYSAYNNFKQQHQGKNQDEGKGTAFIAVLAAGLMIGGLFLGAYIVASELMWRGWVVLSIMLVAFALGFLVNLNNVSLHRMYRDRLMEAFMPNKGLDSLNWQPATEANTTKLSDINVRPYHLVNTNVVLTDSENSKYRSRGGDNFVLSPRLCGSDATGLCKTEEFFGNKMTLATSMAISGAAVNPHTGVAGKGPTRNKLVSFLMAILNIRLGFWAINPHHGYWFRIANYFSPGIKGLSGSGFREDAKWIELTDGGHFENTAVYELIRRRVSLIVMTDGGADPDYHFQDLGNLIERVRVDFGAQITFTTSDDNVSCLEDLVPAEQKGVSYPLAKKGYAVAKIKYSSAGHEQSDIDSAQEGTLILLKPTMVKELPQDVYSYKMSNPNFPQQPTSDQFFDETQFEAYRELGKHITQQMLDEQKHTYFADS